MRYVILGAVICCSVLIAIALWINWDALSIAEQVGWVVGLILLDVIAVFLEPSRKTHTHRGDTA